MVKCIECDEAITQPICSRCLEKEMVVFVSEMDEGLAKEIKGFAVGGETGCLFCGQGMAVCAHCFSRDVYEYLLEKNKTVAGEFLEAFDFELRREIY